MGSLHVDDAESHGLEPKTVCVALHDPPPPKIHVAYSLLANAKMHTDWQSILPGCL